MNGWLAGQSNLHCAAYLCACVWWVGKPGLAHHTRALLAARIIKCHPWAYFDNSLTLETSKSLGFFSHHSKACWKFGTLSPHIVIFVHLEVQRGSVERSSFCLSGISNCKKFLKKQFTYSIINAFDLTNYPQITPF